MDPAGSCKHFYVDVEMENAIKDPLYHYVLISATYNTTLKHTFYSGSVVVHVTGIKYIVLTLLRTKCACPRVDVVLQKLATGEIEMLVDKMAEFRRDYKYLPEEDFADDYDYSSLRNYFVEAGLFWNKARYNKLINGDPDLTSWDASTSSIDEANLMELDIAKKKINCTLPTRKLLLPPKQLQAE